jgi:hypothetical protein
MGWSSDVEDQRRGGPATWRSSDGTEQPGHLEKADSGGRAPSSKVSNVRKENDVCSLREFSQFVLRATKDVVQGLIQ